MNLELKNTEYSLLLENTGDTYQLHLVPNDVILNMVVNAGIDGIDGIDGSDGQDGREIQLRNNGTHIQWKYTIDTVWTNLIAISEFGGIPDAPTDHKPYLREDANWVEATASVVGADPAGAAAQALIDAKAYTDQVATGALIDCGNWNASSNTYPTTGGTGTAGAIKKGNLFYISVSGTLQGKVLHVGDTLRALIDTPGQTDSNWAIIENEAGANPEYANVNITNLTTDATAGGVIPAAEWTWLNGIKALTPKSVLSVLSSIISYIYSIKDTVIFATPRLNQTLTGPIYLDRCVTQYNNLTLSGALELSVTAGALVEGTAEGVIIGNGTNTPTLNGITLWATSAAFSSTNLIQNHFMVWKTGDGVYIAWTQKN